MRSVAAGSFERLSGFQALWHAWHRYRRGKRRRPPVAAFDLDADRHLLALSRALRNGGWRPGRYALHSIRDPKTRLIAAPALRDRVLHQALLDEIGPCYERGFIDHSYACGRGRGVHRAVLQHLTWMRRYPYRLALDVHRYFPSVHLPTLYGLIAQRLRDERTRALVWMLLDSGARVYRHPLAVRILGLDRDPLPLDSGLPIGAYLSQWCGALYLDGLDHFVKRELQAPGYLRYMDDMVLFGADKAALVEAREAIAGWLGQERRLELNPKRRQVHANSVPGTFLGCRVSRAGIAPGGKMTRRMRQRLRALRDAPPERIARSLQSYAAWARFG
jgi:RNA-directed DNA polymerase